MTVTAHGTQRVYRGATRHVSSGSTPQASMFYELNPHLRPKATTQQTIAARIRPWLEEHGPATAQEIATGIGVSDPRNVNDAIRRHRADGVVAVGKRQVSRNKYATVWGVEDIHTDDDEIEK